MSTHALASPGPSRTPLAGNEMVSRLPRVASVSDVSRARVNEVSSLRSPWTPTLEIHRMSYSYRTFLDDPKKRQSLTGLSRDVIDTLSCTPYTFLASRMPNFWRLSDAKYRLEQAWTSLLLTGAVR